MRQPSTALSVSILLALAVLAGTPRGAAQQPDGGPGGALAPAPARPPAHPDTPSIIPHNLEGRADCAGCHGGLSRHPYPADHVGRPSAACLSCHVPSQSSRASVPRTPTPPVVTNEFCLACHTKPDLAKVKLRGGELLDIRIDRDAYARSMHGRKQMSCTACHPTFQKVPHDPLQGGSARELNRGIVQQRCGTCHAEIYAKYKESVHGKALVEDDNLDVPSCTDCHGVHDIRNAETRLFRVDSTDTCSRCHADAQRMAKYGISPNVTRTYLADYHGTTVRLDRKKGDLEFASYKAVCYDCHGIHDIEKTGDPSSQAVKENLVETCRRCHPGAGPNFPTAWTAHYNPDRKRWPLVYSINLFYKLAIPGILGGMGFYIFLELFHAARARIQRRRQS